MRKRRLKLSEAQAAMADELYGHGWSLREIGAHFNCSREAVSNALNPDTILRPPGWSRRAKADPEFRKRTVQRQKAVIREGSKAKRAAGLEYSDRPARDVLAIRRRVRESIDADTRTLAQQHCGDPPPGRSALDQRQQQTIGG